MTTTTVPGFWRRDAARHDGVHPLQLWGMRALYVLMLVFVAPAAWRVLASDATLSPLEAVAWSVWAAYPSLAVFGLLRPLRWIPLLLFTLVYKATWLVVVAWPLVQAGTFEGSAAQPIAESFLAVPLIALVLPWGYVWRELVLPPRRAG